MNAPTKPTSLKIDADALMMALENHTGADHFLDLETGEVVRFPPDDLRDDEDEQARMVEETPARFRQVEPVSSSRSFRLMEDFVQSLPASRERDALARALGGRHPFRAFKDELTVFPARREEWFRFHDDALRKMALAWLEDEDIEGELKGRD